MFQDLKTLILYDQVPEAAGGGAAFPTSAPLGDRLNLGSHNYCSAYPLPQ